MQTKMKSESPISLNLLSNLSFFDLQFYLIDRFQNTFIYVQNFDSSIPDLEFAHPINF